MQLQSPPLGPEWPEERLRPQGQRPRLIPQREAVSQRGFDSTLDKEFVCVCVLIMVYKALICHKWLSHGLSEIMSVMNCPFSVVF